MQEHQDKNIVPTVSRVSGETLVELVYDRSSRTTAFAVSERDKWRIEPHVRLTTGETLVPYAATNNLIRHECVVLPSEPVDHESKDALLADIEAYLYRYVDLSPLFERIAAHYVLLTWVFDAFNELPYLRFRGEYGSGKTRALIALGSIAYKGFFASGASTVSPIFHTLDTFGGTLILDEADFRYSDKTADLVKILNNGTVRGLPVLRTLQNRHKEFSPAAFNVFGPKIIASRGVFRDEALESRFLTEQMGTRPLRPDIPIQLPQSLKDEALSLRNRLLHFRLTNLDAIRTRPERALPDVDPRLNQTVLSLFSLMEDTELREDVASALRVRQGQIAGERGRSVEGRLLVALLESFDASDRTSLPLHEITQRVNANNSEVDEPISSRRIGQVLRVLSIPYHKSHGAAIVPRSSLAIITACAIQRGVNNNR